MSMRIAARYVSRRFSSGGRMLGEEEKAAEAIYIKKTEQEKLEKLARKGPKAEEKPAAAATATSTEGPASDVKPRAPETSTSAGVSTDKNRNYAVVTGVVTCLAALGWYYMANPKKTEEVQD